MNRPPIFAATLAAHGLAEEPRPLGAVSVGLSFIDAPDPRLIPELLQMLANQLCRRCDGVPESNRTCRACAAELARIESCVMCGRPSVDGVLCGDCGGEEL